MLLAGPDETTIPLDVTGVLSGTTLLGANELWGTKDDVAALDWRANELATEEAAVGGADDSGIDEA